MTIYISCRLKKVHIFYFINDNNILFVLDKRRSVPSYAKKKII